MVTLDLRTKYDFIIKTPNNFDFVVIGQCHSNIILICETPTCPNTYT